MYIQGSLELVESVMFTLQVTVICLVAVCSLAGYVEAMAARMGMKIPEMSPKQSDMWQTRVSSHSVRTRSPFKSLHFPLCHSHCPRLCHGLAYSVLLPTISSLVLLTLTERNFLSHPHLNSLPLSLYAAVVLFVITPTE